MPPPDKTMMHGSDYAGQNPRGWIVTVKFDGFFARWTGHTLLTREGVDYNAPDWFIAGLPAFALDCELFAGYGKRTTLNGAPRWKDKSRWSMAELVVFDAPQVAGGYAERLSVITDHAVVHPNLRVIQWWTCSSKSSLIEVLESVRNRGGEGLVIRHPTAPYTIGRVATVLKVKPEFIRYDGWFERVV